VRLDSELRRLYQRLAVCVDSDAVDSPRGGLRERPVAAPEIEHTAAGPAHVPLEECLALRTGEHEARASLGAIVLGVPLAQLF
jgi:hypothetical protein